MATNDSWLRITTFALPSDQSSAVEYVRSSVSDVTRLFRGQRGYTGGYWGDCPEDRTYSAVLHWTSLEAIQDAGKVLEEQLARRAAAGFKVLDVKNIRITAVWREARQAAAGDGRPARVVERPLQLPASSLVSGHPAQARAGQDSAEVHVDTRLHILTSRLDPRDEARSLAYLQSTADATREVLQSQRGFRLAYRGRIEGGGSVVTLTYWSDGRALRDAEPAMDRLMAERAANGVEIESVRALHLFALPSYVKPEMAGV